MNSVLLGTPFNESLISQIDIKISSWQSLLPASKHDALNLDGSVDEVLWYAHLSVAT
jgi:hypothetical protein